MEDNKNGAFSSRPELWLGRNERNHGVFSSRQELFDGVSSSKLGGAEELAWGCPPFRLP